MRNRNIEFNLGIFGNFEEIRSEYESGKTRTRVVEIDCIKLRMDLGSTIHVYYQYTYRSKDVVTSLKHGIKQIVLLNGIKYSLKTTSMRRYKKYMQRIEERID